MVRMPNSNRTLAKLREALSVICSSAPTELTAALAVYVSGDAPTQQTPSVCKAEGLRARFNLQPITLTHFVWEHRLMEILREAGLLVNIFQSFDTYGLVDDDSDLSDLFSGPLPPLACYQACVLRDPRSVGKEWLAVYELLPSPDLIAANADEQGTKHYPNLSTGHRTATAHSWIVRQGD